MTGVLREEPSEKPMGRTAAASRALTTEGAYSAYDKAAALERIEGDGLQTYRLGQPRRDPTGITSGDRPDDAHCTWVRAILPLKD